MRRVPVFISSVVRTLSWVASPNTLCSRRSASARRRTITLVRHELCLVHSHGDGLGAGDTRHRGLARRRARHRRARTSNRSGCPSALPCPETQPVRPQHQNRCARHAAGSVASTFILGTGEGEGDARRLGLGLGLVHCRDPVVNWSSSAPLVVTWIS